MNDDIRNLRLSLPLRARREAAKWLTGRRATVHRQRHNSMWHRTISRPMSVILCLFMLGLHQHNDPRTAMPRRATVQAAWPGMPHQARVRVDPRMFAGNPLAQRLSYKNVVCLLFLLAPMTTTL